MNQEKPKKIRNYSINDLDRLILSIKQANPELTDELISSKMGYNEGYISQCKSRGEVSDKFINALKREFKIDTLDGKRGTHETTKKVTPETYLPIEELDILVITIMSALNISEKEISRRLGYEDYHIEEVKRQGRVSSSFLHELRTEFKSVLGNINNTTASDLYLLKRRHLKNNHEGEGISMYESAPVYASFNHVYRDDPEHEVPDYVLRIPQFRDCNYGTRASGDSMYPEIRNGDLVVCKELSKDARVIFGDIYVVHTKDGLETIKYIQQFIDDSAENPTVLLVPHNKAAGMGTPMPRNEITRLFKVRAIFKAY